MEWIFILFSLFLLLIISSPVIISVWAYRSRQSKRNRIPLPDEVVYKTPVRLNTNRTHRKFWKIKGFEYSGWLYVVGNKVCVKGTGGQYSEYDLLSCLIEWPGVAIQNGVLDWISVGYGPGNKLYVNAETGVFVFRTGSRFPATSEVFANLLHLQELARASYRPVPPPVSGMHHTSVPAAGTVVPPPVPEGLKNKATTVPPIPPCS